MSEEECNTCGDTGRWESTTEESPTELVYVGPCPDCPRGKMKQRLHDAARELLALIDRTINPSYADVTGEEQPLYSTENRVVREDWAWGSYYDGKMHYSPPAPLAILWEEGPDDWTTEVTLGAPFREVDQLQRKYDVLFEPYTSWALGIYDEIDRVVGDILNG